MFQRREKRRATARHSWLLACALLSGLPGGEAVGHEAAFTFRMKAQALAEPRMHATVHRQDLTDAWAAYDCTRLDEAENLFRRVALSPRPPAPDLCQALFGLGWCRAFRSPLPDVDGAARHFERIVTEFPASQLAPWALVELGNLHVEKGRPGQDAGRTHYRRALERYPDSAAAHEAALRLANSLFYELTEPQMAAGAEILKQHLRRYPNNPLAVIMHFRLDYFYGDIRQDWAACLPHAIKVAELKLSDPFRWSRQYWHVAEILRLRLGRGAEAAKWYRKIVDECPDSMHALVAGEILAALQAEIFAEGGR